MENPEEYEYLYEKLNYNWNMLTISTKFAEILLTICLFDNLYLSVLTSLRPDERYFFFELCFFLILQIGLVLLEYWIFLIDINGFCRSYRFWVKKCSLLIHVSILSYTIFFIIIIFKPNPVMTFNQLKL